MKTYSSKLGIAAAAAALALVPAARAQFTYTGGNLNLSQTYDGLGVDSALNPHTFGNVSANDYIGTGSGGNGSLTVQSGTLTINASDFKIANGHVSAVGVVSVASGATLNINQVGQWGGGVGQVGSGTLNITGGTVNWQTSGSSEQRFMVGNGTGGVGTLNLNGGTLYNFFDVSQALTDAERQFRAGSDGGLATLNLNAGTWRLDGNVPFFLGGKYNNLNATPGIVQSATVSKLNILNGDFFFTGIIAAIDAAKSTFTVGANDKVNFLSGGSGELSLQGWQQSDFLALATGGKLQIDGADVADLSSFNYQFAGGQGIISLVPEPTTGALAGLGLLLGAMSVRRRRA